MRSLGLVGRCGALVALYVLISMPAHAQVHPPAQIDEERAAPVMGTVSVTPSADLADGQVVSVSGTGWAPGAFVDLHQCDSTYTNCIGDGVPTFADAQGVFPAHDFSVRALLPDADGSPSDCRVEECVILAHDVNVDGFHPRQVSITFDPTAPLLPPPDLEVDPAFDVLDGVALRVTGRFFTPADSLELMLCTAAPSSVDDCESGGNQNSEVRSDLRGDLNEYIPAVATFRTGRGDPVDCRVLACDVAVFHFFFGGDFLQGPPIATASVSFDPDGPLLGPPSVTATPTTDLTSGQIVSVIGDGFRAAGYVEVFQCPTSSVTSDPLTIAGCDYGSHKIDYDLDADGHMELAIKVHRTFVGVSGVDSPERRVDCLTERCSLAVVDSRSTEAVVFPLQFQPSAGTPGQSPPVPAPARPASRPPQFTG